MKRKILTALYIILILITMKLLFNIITNSVLINKYEKGQYSESQAKLLTYMNFPQSYVANYNYGNILYQNGEYEDAIEEYKKALKGNPPKDKDCNIRINCALAICKTVQVDETDQNSIKTAIDTYESAIDILTENGCANKDDNNGHNQKAEQLKKDIQDEIDRLKNLQEDESNDSKEEQKDETNEEKEEIEEKIQDIKEEATQAQREKESVYRDFNKDFNRMNKKNW